MRFLPAFLVVFSALPVFAAPRTVRLPNGKIVRLNLPPNAKIQIAAQGFSRPRFMAIAPDGRVFLTQMQDKSDNSRGKIWVLSDFQNGVFRRKSVYLDGLRNPNSLAFWTDKSGKSWLYLALTDKLVRFPFQNGDLKPSGAPQTLAIFPAYGLSYKYGGWHLTRTVEISPSGEVFVSVGSSGNAVIEKEPQRATILQMDADGKNQTVFARGLRNAVGLKFVGETLYATNMGADHLGDYAPNDTLLRIENGADYGWPSVYVKDGKNYRDPKFAREPKRVDPQKVPLPVAAFAAHASPLGLEFFGNDAPFPELKNSFLVALHGSGFTRIGSGYELAIVPFGVQKPVLKPQIWLRGFLRGRRIAGRPCDVLRWKNGILVSDDYANVVYFISPQSVR